MFDVLKIQDELYGVVGLEQSFNPTYAILDANNQISRSGYKSNVGNSMVKIEYIKDSQDYVDISDVDFNTLIRNTQKSSIAKVCNDVFDNVEFRDRGLVYENAMNKVNTNIMPDGFIGYKIKFTKAENVSFKINRVILDFEGIGDITIRLYSSQQKEHLFEKVVPVSSTTQEVELNWEVNNSGAAYKGEYLIGYINNSALTPFSRDYESSNVKTRKKDYYVQDVYYSDHTSNLIPDLTKETSISDYCGVNLDITTYNDYTDIILREWKMFAKAIDLQFQIDLMSISMSSLRSNSNERNSTEMYNEMVRIVNGFHQEGVIHIKGLLPRLIAEISSISEQIEKIKRGILGSRIKVRTIVN